ncbi:MAG: MBL fold metallo-hydrolase [Tannerellaceae bacterium]|nr:MBL fold metallo-hydrolase [Tannerellaceae bacterium]
MSRKKKIIGFIGSTVVIILCMIAWYVLSEMGHLYSDRESQEKYAGYSYYDTKEQHFISPEKLEFYPERTTGGNAGMKRFFTQSPNAPKEDLPKVNLTRSGFSAVPSNYALYWLGHSSAILELDGIRILIDPVLDNAAPFPGIAGRYTGSPVKRKELPDIDIVLISHDHYDHLEARTIKYLKDRKIRFVTPLGAGARLKGWGVPAEHITEMAWGDSISVSSVQIAACPAVHYSGRTRNDRNKTLWAAYAIKGSDKNIFWSGDTGYGEHIREIGEKYGPFDLACVEMDGWNNGWPNTHLFPDEAVQVAREVGAKIMLPIHWGVFDLALHPWNESIQKVYDLSLENGIELLTPLMGEKVVPGVSKTKVWWKL